MKTVTTLGVLSAAVLGLSATGAQAAGFQLMEQNASGIGNAFAGSAALGDNASTIFFNPAGMTRLPGVNVSVGAAAVRPSFKFDNNGSAVPGPLGSDGGDAGSWSLVPNAYISWELTPKWYAGVGVSAPFGLITEYSDDWTGRYQSKKFDVQTINVNPSVAYKVNDRLSLGAGVNWMHLDAEYSRAVPFAFPATVYRGDLDATVDLKGDAWGWNVGALYQATPSTRIGVSYRSKMTIDADGATRIRNHNVNAPFSAGIPPGLRADASTSVELPPTAVLSVVHDLNDRWQLLADISWTGWSSIRRLDIVNTGNPLVGSDSLDLRFRDTWRLALGANYTFNQRWTFKGGVAWDQSPVHDDRFRPTSLPDNDRYWVSVGAQYNFNDRTKIDVGYAHLFLKDTSIDNVDARKGAVRGDYDSNANLLGIQVSHRF
jgi:long-chain fatty acid transport protein